MRRDATGVPAGSAPEMSIRTRWRRRHARLLRPLRSAYLWQSHRLAPRLSAVAVDLGNVARYGPSAPRFAERLWVDPMLVEHYIRGTRGSGRVIMGDWSTDQHRPIEEDPIFRAAVERWVHGRSWEESGEVERMEAIIAVKGPIKGCRTRADILRRCAQLDAIFETIAREQRLRTQAEVERGAFRELGGVGMHIGANGVPIRATNGRHRFAMARILELPRIPVRIGMVHHSALPLLDELRRGP